MKPLRTFIFLALVLSGPIAPAQQIALSNYGWLDQFSLSTPGNDIGSESCVPTSATNAMTMLQIMYPEVYGTSLTGSNTDYSLWVTTATELITLMGTDMHGTTYAQAVYALYDYITITNGFSSTQFSGMFPTNNWYDPYPQPTFGDFQVGHPDIDFLLDAVEGGEALLLSLTYVDNINNGHELLVNGVEWDAANNRGQLYFVDPLNPVSDYPDGQPGNSIYQSVGSLRLDEYGELILTYDQYQGNLPYEPGNFETYELYLYGAMAINVPEPSTWALILISGMGCVVMLRRRARANA